MEIAQTEYLLKNGIGPIDCNSCSKSLVGSIKSYAQHLLICNGQSSKWGSHIGDAGIPQLVVNAIERCNRELHKQESGIIVTAIDYSHEVHSEKVAKIICYPEGAVYEMPSDSDFYLFMKHVIMKKDFDLHRSKSTISNDDIGKEKEVSDDIEKEINELKMPNIEDAIVPISANTKSPFIHSPTYWKTVVLVCVHASRDNRCGRAGPQVVEELDSLLLQRSITKDSITVVGCSHIGGHKYAGVLVVYPQGDWYGMISKRSAGDLLDHIVAGKKYLKGWRGNESLTW